MNILFLTLIEINDFNQTGIYPDLIKEFANHGHDIYVISSCERKNKSNYVSIRENGKIHLISALIPDYFGVGFIKKGISSLLISKCYYNAIKKSVPEVKFDLVLYSTPPITFCNVIEKIKKRDNAVSYLLLKDIWPQGPIDIGALSTKGIKGYISKYFRLKERKLYSISDYIGCMSSKNCQYIIKKSGVDESKVEICPNSIKVNDKRIINKNDIRISYSLPTDKTIFVYGGNLGVAQGIDFIISCLIENERNTNETFILIIGSGMEYDRLQDWFNNNNPKKCKLLAYLPKEEYMKVMSACDVGLIFLDHRFSIPNFPSRLLSYMEAGMPVLAATDSNTDVGEVIEKGRFGYWCESNDVSSFISKMNCFLNENNRKIQGDNAYDYLINNYTVEHSYEIIMSHFI